MTQQPARATNSAIVYEALNLVNGHRYIGFTAQGLQRREWQHRQSVKAPSGCRKLKAALQEFGGDNFVFRVLADFAGDEELGLVYEEEVIAKYSPEYNLRGGGSSGGSMAKETRQKLSDVQKGRPSPLRGVPISAAHRQAIIDGKAKRDNRHSPETVAKIRANRGPYVVTDETRKKISAALRSVGTRNRKVMCVEDGRVFGSCRAADEFYGWNHGRANYAVTKNASTGGKHFVYVEEGDE